MRPISFLGLLILLSHFCGCRAGGQHSVQTPTASPSPAVVEAGKTQPPAVRKSDENFDLTATEEDKPIRQVSDSTGDPSPLRSLSLTECVSLSLAQNPDLIALRQADNVGSAVLGVAETYPFNPFVQVQATPYQDNRVIKDPGTTYHYVLLMQTLQLAHQQQFREQSASFALNSIRWNIHQAELLNVAQTERLYFTVLYQQGLLELAQATHENNLQLQKTLQKQLDAGQATAADVAIVSIDTRSTRHQVRLARANALTAVRDLQRQMGLTPESTAGIGGDLRKITWQLPGEMESGAQAAEKITSDRAQAIAVEWSACRPDVMAAHSDIDVARANCDLASASRTPDLQIGPYYQRTADGTTFVGFRGQMDIPVINNGKPLVNQREAEHGQRVMTWNQVQRRAELEAIAAFERYDLAFALVREDLASATASFPEELQNLEKQFLAGEVDIVRVVQARTSLIQNQRVKLDMLNELAQASANLTAATGIPPADLCFSSADR